METDYVDNVSSSEEDDEETYSDSSDELNSDYEMQQTNHMNKVSNLAETAVQLVEANAGPNNIVQKLFNRERFGNYSGVARYSQFAEQRVFKKVPNRLQFCLKDIMPTNMLHGHVFMGLSACGQFVLSYKMISKENVVTNHYSFNMGFNYTLYFWVYQPHKTLSKFYKCCLFDDHGVDNMKQVTMTQWKNCDPRILVVHGASYDEGEDSYVTYVKVPKLGCLDCKKLRENETCGLFHMNELCLKCNLTVHTKYSTVESDRKFNPYTNLICPDRILLISNGFMHMLQIDLETIATTVPQSTITTTTSYMQYSNLASPNQLLLTMKSPQQCSSNSIERRQSQLSSSTDEFIPYDNYSNVVARIQADFSDIETASTTSNDSRQNDMIRDSYLAITALARRGTNDDHLFNRNVNATNVSAAGAISATTTNVINAETAHAARAVLVSPRAKRHHRIVTKSFRNGVITVDMQGLPSTSTATTGNLNDKSSAYDFSEDNEKCEKIATLRKRRLAEKKYEFSEDNSENIVPFTKIRSANRSGNGTRFGGSPSSHVARSLHRATATAAHAFHRSPCASPSSSPHTSIDSRHYTLSPLPTTHCVSPITTVIPQGFRSPQSCGSPVSVTNFMRSPKTQGAAAGVAQMHNQKSPPTSSASLTLSTPTQQMLSFKPLGALSPLQVSMTKLNQLELSCMSPNTHAIEVPTQAGLMPEKPVCTKKLQRRYVEEDDAASVITSEEDDCISPGYHTSLPMEVHGSWYTEMHMISQASYQQLRCPSVVITQHSFDLETFTYYAISILCQKNQKTYDVFYDWAYDIISVCPVSQTVICVLLAQFSARDQLPATQTNCLNCSRKLDCAFHRRQFECRILFTWHMETDEWDVLDYGELKECKAADVFTPIKRCGTASLSLSQQAKKLVQEMSADLNRTPNYTDNLRVLDSNIKKSKKNLTDLDNMIEFHLKRPPRNN